MTPSFLSFIFAILTAAPEGVGRADLLPVTSMSQQEMEVRVRIDAARQFEMTFEEVSVTETKERTWPDGDLGCNARPRVIEPKPIPGFRILVHAGTRRLTYHTDRAGRVLRCTTPTKPLDPRL